MLDAIVVANKGIKGPSFHDIRGAFLQNGVGSINEYLNGFEESWTITGGTSMSNGWNDGRSHTILIFLLLPTRNHVHEISRCI
jgi:hypothetical protein